MIRPGATFMTLALCVATAHGEPAGEPSDARRASLEEALVSHANGALSSPLVAIAATVPATLVDAEPAPELIAIDWRRPPRAGLMSLQSRWREADGRIRKVWTRVRIATRAPVLVAARPLRAGAAIVLEDLRVEERASEDGWQMAPGVLVGAPIIADASVGTLITPAVVEQPAPIARGTELSVVVRHGRVEVTVVGVLERATRPGEPAAARLVSDRRVVRGRLVDATTLLVTGDAR